jgi:tRNA nucleotidyltransferase/poly(A) polymerase
MVQINTNFIPKTSKAYIVGGTVRDALLGISPKDYDIVTLDDPERLAGQIAAMSGGKIIKLGKPGLTIFRVITKNLSFDVAPAVK